MDADLVSFGVGTLTLSWRNKLNRKLIRPTLTRTIESKLVPEGRRDWRTTKNSPEKGERGKAEDRKEMNTAPKKKIPPPAETHAETYYYKKQIDLHSLMVVVMLDGEEIEGTIEWYDLDALKINRKNLPNLLVPKRSIKYMFKAEERGENRGIE
jgi:hypothetical protein